MPSIASVLKQEITRLARKEAKAQITPLKKANAQYRRDIAELKRQLRQTKKEVETVARQQRNGARSSAAASKNTGMRFSAKGLRSHRERLELAAADYAELVGVSAQTIYNWEHGKSVPQQQQLASLAAIRGLGKREAWRRLEG